MGQDRVEETRKLLASQIEFLKGLRAGYLEDARDYARLGFRELARRYRALAYRAGVDAYRLQKALGVC